MTRASRVRSSVWKVSNKRPGNLNIFLCNIASTWPHIHGYMFVCKVFNHLWLYFSGYNASDSDSEDLLEDSWALLSTKSFSWSKLSFHLRVGYWSTFTSFALCFLIILFFCLDMSVSMRLWYFHRQFANKTVNCVAVLTRQLTHFTLLGSMQYYGFWYCRITCRKTILMCLCLVKYLILLSFALTSVQVKASPGFL